MSVNCICAVCEHSQQRGDPYLVLLVMADEAGDDGCTFPRLAALAARARLDKAALLAALERLETSGEIAIAPYLGLDGESGYQICLPGAAFGDTAEDSSRAMGVSDVGRS